LAVARLVAVVGFGRLAVTRLDLAAFSASMS